MHLFSRYPFESGFRLLHCSTYRHTHRAAVSSCRYVHARRRARNLTDLSPAHLLVNHVPVLIGGLAMSGIILSLLGSIGGLSLGIGTMISHDILSPLLKITDDKSFSA